MTHHRCLELFQVVAFTRWCDWAAGLVTENSLTYDVVRKTATQDRHTATQVYFHEDSNRKVS